MSIHRSTHERILSAVHRAHIEIDVERGMEPEFAAALIDEFFSKRVEMSELVFGEIMTRTSESDGDFLDLFSGSATVPLAIASARSAQQVVLTDVSLMYARRIDRADLYLNLENIVLCRDPIGTWMFPDIPNITLLNVGLGLPRHDRATEEEQTAAPQYIAENGLAGMRERFPDAFTRSHLRTMTLEILFGLASNHQHRVFIADVTKRIEPHDPDGEIISHLQSKVDAHQRWSLNDVKFLDSEGRIFVAELAYS